MVVDCVNIDRSKIGETAYNRDCDLPLCFGNQVLTWDNVLFSIISKDNAVLLVDVSVFVKGCSGKGYNC